MASLSVFWGDLNSLHTFQFNHCLIFLILYTTMTILWPFVRDYPGEPVPEETLTHPLFGLPLSLERSTSYSIHFFTQSVSSFRSTCPYHRNLFCCSTCISIISSIPSLSVNSLLGTLSFTLTLHIHLTILISARWSATSKIGSKLVLITNRKSYVSFRLVLKSLTLNGLERRNGPYFALFHRIFVYDVVAKLLSGLPRFHNLIYF